MSELIIKGRVVLMWAIAVWVVITSCNEPTDLGSELIPQGDIFFRDTWDLSASTVEDDSLLVYNQTTQRVTTLLCGNVDDPVFGNYSSQFYARLIPLTRPRELAEAVIDSVILSVAYRLDIDTYGDMDAPHSVSVHILDEKLETSETYYATDTVAYQSIPNGQKLDFVPDTSFRPEILELDPQDDGSDTIRFDPHLRIALDTQFWSGVFGDTLNYLDDSVFQTFFPGICVRPAAKSGGMLHFSMPNNFTRITVYYTVGDTMNNHLDIIADDVASVRFSSFNNRDYAGSIAGNGLTEPNYGDSLLFIQSMQGLSTKINVNDVLDLENFIVNHAVLEVFTLQLHNDDTVAYTVPNLIAASFEENEELIWTDDLQAAVARGNLGLFGGEVIDTINVNGTSVRGYRINISNHFQDMVFGNAPSELVIETFLETIRVNRAVLAGPNHPEYPIRLKVTYSSN